MADAGRLRSMGWYASDDAFLNKFEGVSFLELCDTLLDEKPEPPPADDPESPDDNDRGVSRHFLINVPYNMADDPRPRKYAKLEKELQDKEKLLQAQAAQLAVG